MIELLLCGPEATAAFGQELGRRLRSGEALALRGDLGAGKTTLARGVGCGLGLDAADEVCSPTYLLLIEHSGPVPMMHVDAYLPDKLRGFLEDGGVDYLAESRGVIVVEWAERIADLMPAKTLWVTLEPTSVDGVAARRVRIEDPANAFPWTAELSAAGDRG